MAMIVAVDNADRMKQPILNRTSPSGLATAVAAGNTGRMSRIDAGRAERLLALADRLERTLVHQLIELAPMAWSGDDAAASIEKIRACSLQLVVAANGLRATADHVGVEP